MDRVALLLQFVVAAQLLSQTAAPLNDNCEREFTRYCPGSGRLTRGDCLACCLQSPITGCKDTDIAEYCSKNLAPHGPPPPPPGTTAHEPATQLCQRALAGNCPTRGDTNEGACLSCSFGPRLQHSGCTTADVQSYCAGETVHLLPTPPPPPRLQHLPPPPPPPLTEASQACLHALASQCPNQGVRVGSCLACALHLSAGCKDTDIKSFCTLHAPDAPPASQSARRPPPPPSPAELHCTAVLAAQCPNTDARMEDCLACGRRHTSAGCTDPNVQAYCVSKQH